MCVDFKVGEKVQYDPGSSMTTWRGVVWHVTPKHVDILRGDGKIIRVRKDVVFYD